MQPSPISETSEPLPLNAELWDGPASTARTVFEFAKAWLTGEEPSLGQNRKVTVAM
jgi:hypothetical protein